MKFFMYAKRALPLLLSLLLAIFILWSLLLPGYVLTLDAGMTPSIPLPSVSDGALANGLPQAWLWYALGLVMSSWVVQKIMLLSLFVLMPLCAYYFLLSKDKSVTARMWVALFYTINPFVYTRFLAGQWGILFAYALAPIAFASILKLVTPYQEGHRVWGIGRWAGVHFFTFFKKIFSKKEEDGNHFFLRPTTYDLRPFFLALVFIFSPHIGAMLVIATAFAYLWRLIASKGNRMCVCAKGFAQAGILLILTSYWTVPALLQRKGLAMSSFGVDHWEAFRTAAQYRIGTLGNVLTLYGFWGERKPWATQFYWANRFWAPLTIISACLIAVLILLGIIVLLRNRETRSKGIFLSGLLIASVVFSCGIGEGIFRPLNFWMFEHIPFWYGFRDTQKWTTLIIISYAIFAGTGFEYLLKKLESKTRILSYALRPTIYALVLVYTAPMLFGFSGLLKPVWYPKSWNQVNQLLRYQPNCKAIFIPWHMYYTSNFAGTLISNPAKRYFSCNILMSEDTELEGLTSLQKMNFVDVMVTGRSAISPEEVIAALKAEGIHYVISAKDMASADKYKYDFLKAEGITTKDFGDITLFEF